MVLMKKITKRILIKMTVSLFIFLVLTIAYPLIRYKLYSVDEKTIGKNKTPFIVGHRGAAGISPENTINSFKKAIELDVDYIEFDLHVSKDGNLIVIHDSNIKRTTDGEGEVEDLTLNELKKYSAGSWFGDEYTDEKIPTFEEVIEILDEERKLLIELKWPKKGIYQDLVSKVVDIVMKAGLQDRVVIQSFESSYLEEIENMNSNIECHQLLFGKSSLLPFYYDRSMKFGKFESQSRVTSLNWFYMYSDKRVIEKNARVGIKTGVFTVNKKEDMLKLASMGIDYLITDYPNIANEALK